MKKNILRICALFLLLCLLPACAQNTNSGSKRLHCSGVFAESGYYYVENDILKYADLSAGTTVCLCQKVGCNHTDIEVCEAYVGVGILGALFYWNDGVYYQMNDQHGTQLCRRNADGTGLSVVATLCKDYMEEDKEIDCNFQDGIILDGKLYYYTSVYAVVETEPQVFTSENIYDLINCVDLRTGKEETLVKKDGGRLNLAGLQNGVLYYEETDLGDTSAENYTDTMGELPSRLNRYDLSTGETATVLEKKLDDFRGVEVIFGSKVYYLDTTAEGKVYRCYDMKDGADTQIATGHVTILNERYLLRRSQNKDWDWELVDMQKEKTLPCFFFGQRLSVMNMSDQGAVFDLKEYVDGKHTGKHTYFYASFQSLADGIQEEDCVFFQ